MSSARRVIGLVLGLAGLLPIAYSCVVSGLGSTVWVVATHTALLLMASASPIVTNGVSISLLFPVLMPAIMLLSPVAAGIIGAVGSLQKVQLRSGFHILALNRTLVGLPAFLASLIYHRLALGADLWSQQSLIAMILAAYWYETLNIILMIVAVKIVRPRQSLNAFALLIGNLKSFTLSLAIGLIVTLVYGTSQAVFILVALLFVVNRDTFRSMAINQNLYVEIINAMVKVIENTDPYTKGHSERVATYCEATGRKLGLKPLEINRLHLIATLHDLGKHSIPPEVLRKPGRLTAEEYEMIKQHCEKGENLLHEISLFKPMHLRAVSEHHERWDGKGYPKGLKGEEICFWARIIAVADAFDAMTSDRPYRSALPVEAAVAELVQNSGSQFDPAVVKAFVAIVETEPVQQALRSRNTPPAPVAPGAGMVKPVFRTLDS